MHREPATMPTPGTGMVVAKKPRKLGVFNFKDACKALRKALDEIDQHKAIGQELIDERDKSREARSAERRAREAAEESAKATREQFADLKQRLFNSEQECARLRGYMERVHEDDAVADPLVEVEDQNGKRMVSKRHPAPRFENYGATSALGCEYDQYGRQKEKPKHWVTY